MNKSLGRDSSPASALPGAQSSPSKRSRIQTRAMVALCAGLLLSGCGRDSDEPRQTGNVQAPAVRDAAVPGPDPLPKTQTLQVQQGADPNVVLEELNRELRRWLVSNQRTPASFEEFISSSRMEVPPPPPGKKYVLTRKMRVELVKQ
jgi:hypothetical protein